MFRERGRIIHIENGVARVAIAPEPTDACGKTCGCGQACRVARGEFDAPAPPGASVGDDVTIEVPTPGVAGSAVLLLLIPAALFVGGAIAADTLRRRGAPGGGSGWAVLAGAMLMALWYGIMAIYDRHLRRSPEHRPRIVGRPGRPETPRDAGD